MPIVVDFPQSEGPTSAIVVLALLIFMELLFVCPTGVQSKLLKNATNYEKMHKIDTQIQINSDQIYHTSLE